MADAGRPVIAASRRPLAHVLAGIAAELVYVAALAGLALAIVVAAVLLR